MTERGRTFYAWVEVEADGSQGIIAGAVEGLERLGLVPLHNRTLAVVEHFRGIALAHGRAAGRTVRLVEYQQTRVIEEHGK